MTATDARADLRAYINERWAAIQPNAFPGVSELRVRLDEVTRAEADWFLNSVTRHGDDPPLFEVQDNNKDRSDRYPPNADGRARGNSFFERFGETCSLRLETIIHMGATWRLHNGFGWPREHLVVESPDAVDEDRRKVLSREALDILALEKPCSPLPSKMALDAARARIGVEVKALTPRSRRRRRSGATCSSQNGT